MDKEKYQRYLCSEEWGRLRAAVKARANGICEYKNCGMIGTHTHHLTYTRLYHEQLEDLQLLCEMHHDKVHGRKLDSIKRFETCNELKDWFTEKGIKPAEAGQIAILFLSMTIVYIAGEDTSKENIQEGIEATHTAIDYYANKIRDNLN
jgi:hypothetical protein